MKVSRFLIIAFCGILSTLSCAKDSFVVSGSPSDFQSSAFTPSTEIVLGQKLSNPYSLSVMQKALDSLMVQTKTDASSIMLEISGQEEKNYQ